MSRTEAARQLHLLNVYARPEAWYVRACSRDQRLTWWANEFVGRVPTPVQSDVLLVALRQAMESTRRDLPAPASWRDAPDDPGKAKLLKSAGVRSITAFHRDMAAVTLEYFPDRVRVARQVPTSGGLTSRADLMIDVSSDDESVLIEAIMRELSELLPPPA